MDMLLALSCPAQDSLARDERGSPPEEARGPRRPVERESGRQGAHTGPCLGHISVRLSHTRAPWLE